MNKRQAKKQAKRRAEISRQFSSDIYSTGAEVQSAVNRINNRIRNSVKHFGAESKIVQDMYSKIDALIPIENQRYNADGVLQIAKPYQLYRDIDLHQTIENLDKSDIKAYGDIKAEYQKAYESYLKSPTLKITSYKGVTVDKMSIDEYIDVFSDLPSKLAWAYEWKDVIEEAREIIDIMQQDGVPTYDDLIRVDMLYKSGYPKSVDFDLENME